MISSSLLLVLLALGFVVLVGVAFFLLRTKVTAAKPQERPTVTFRCPSCASPHTAEPYREQARPLSPAERLEHLGVVRCLTCRRSFDEDGEAVAPEIGQTLAAMDSVAAESSSPDLQIDEDSTASERAHHLRKAFRQRGLPVDDAAFAVARRELARRFGVTEPESRDEEKSKPTWSGWSGVVPRDGLIGASVLRIDAETIQFGTVRISKDKAAYFTSRPRPGRGMWELACVQWNGRRRTIAYVSEKDAPALKELVLGMEEAMGWLI